MFFLKLLQTQVCSGFVVAHVVVPGLRELEELSLLGSFNILKLLFLSGSNIVLLSLGFFAKELLEFGTSLSSFGVVALFFALAAVFFQQAQEVKHFRVSLNVNQSAARNSSL